MKKVSQFLYVECALLRIYFITDYEDEDSDPFDVGKTSGTFIQFSVWEKKILTHKSNSCDIFFVCFGHATKCSKYDRIQMILVLPLWLFCPKKILR